MTIYFMELKFEPAPVASIHSAAEPEKAVDNAGEIENSQPHVPTRGECTNGACELTWKPTRKKAG